ncbi:MAG: acetate--CoA ligase family protein, partial [Desulfovibrio sp.]|nr:acetate--CoA ligase family protein [Desulfovibrio sp.]
MNIHEYQAKGLFAKYGIPVPQGYLALTPQEAVEAAGKLEAPWVVKAQVHAGGRGKAGGVKVCKTVEEVEAAAKAIIGMKLVTKQTGEAGKIVH